ncbi:hypothetical protein [Methylomonas sp. AM2-LC]|uniref:hypothetical protein n=1 Tax=Methylomonas sp. AM2-LC TaxID=3153301 RepID=UPI003267E375
MTDQNKNKTNTLFSVRPLFQWLAVFALMLSAGLIAYQNGLLTLLGYEATTINANLPATTPSIASLASNAPDPVKISIAQETSNLALPKRNIELTTEKALAAKAAIKRNDFSTAAQITGDVLAHSKLLNWRFYPFNDFMRYFFNETDYGYLEYLDKWVAQEPKSALAHLLRAQWYYSIGQGIRGYDFSSKVADTHLQTYEDYLQNSDKDILAAIHLNAENPYSYFMYLNSISRMGDSPETEQAFQLGINKFPTYYALYRARLKSLTPKWGGSPQAMYAFTSKYADKAKEHSPLKMLYLQLYNYMVDAASIACSSDKERDKCVGEVMAKLIKPRMADDINTALELYNKTDPYQFALEINSILLSLAETSGADHFSGSILQLASDRMGSQLQLVDNNSGHNNYLLDQVAAKSWEDINHYENAEKKYQEALLDIKNTRFPNEEEQFIALADIYLNFASMYFDNAKYAKAIVYQNAAIAMGGGRFDKSLSCGSYFNLKYYTDAIQACSARIESGADMHAYWWRAASYMSSNQADAALTDFKKVADSESSYRESAVINLSAIYAQKQDYPQMLSVFKSHPFLLDEEQTTDHNQLMIGFNNRCYAYMQLGELQKALDDCTSSLKYGNLPDAFQKQQTLVKMLKEKNTH